MSPLGCSFQKLKPLGKAVSKVIFSPPLHPIPRPRSFFFFFLGETIQCLSASLCSSVKWTPNTSFFLGTAMEFL